MTCLPFVSSSVRGLSADAAIAGAGVVRLTLEAGAQAALDVGTDRVSLDVRRGSVWLTQDAVDHVLEAGTRFDCDARRRVVVTALAGSIVEVRREPRR